MTTIDLTAAHRTKGEGVMKTRLLRTQSTPAVIGADLIEKAEDLARRELLQRFKEEIAALPVEGFNRGEGMYFAHSHAGTPLAFKERVLEVLNNDT